MVWNIKRKIQVPCGEGEFPFGEGAAGIRQRVMDVEVPQNKIRIGKKTKQMFRWDGAIRGRLV